MGGMPAQSHMSRDPSEYQREESLAIDSSRALETGRTILLSHGFKLTTPSQGILEAAGPGMTSSKQAPLLGVSQLRISANESSLRVAADLGGLRLIKLTLFGLPFGLAAIFLLVFGIMDGFSWRYAWPLLPWVVVAPLIARWLEGRTVKALDFLVHNMVATPPE